jgi:phage terminase small subunit
MKPETIHNNAYKLMQRNEIATRVAALQSAAIERSELDVVETLQEVRRLALSDIRNAFHPDGRMKLPHELDANTAACIASVEIDAEGKIKYKLWDKNSALERAAKILGLFEKDNRQKTDPLAELFKSLSGNVVRPVRELHAPGDDE